MTRFQFPLGGTGLLGPDSFAPQAKGVKDWDFDILGLPTHDSYLTVDWSNYSEVLNQRSTSTCVAHAWEQAILIEAKRRQFTGSIVELGSRLAGCYHSRALHGAEYSDVGTYLRTYAQGLKLVGRVPESVWPFDPKKVTTRPSIRAHQQAYRMRGLKGYYRIFDTGDRKLTAIDAALHNGHPVVFGMRINDAFRNFQGPSIITVPNGPFIGGHAMCIVGSRYANGQRYYKTINSWSDKWRDRGFVELTEEVITWQYMQDTWVVSLV